MEKTYRNLLVSSRGDLYEKILAAPSVGQKNKDISAMFEANSEGPFYFSSLFDPQKFIQTKTYRFADHGDPISEREHLRRWDQLRGPGRRHHQAHPGLPPERQRVGLQHDDDPHPTLQALQQTVQE